MTLTFPTLCRRACARPRIITIRCIISASMVLSAVLPAFFFLSLQLSFRFQVTSCRSHAISSEAFPILQLSIRFEEHLLSRSVRLQHTTAPERTFLTLLHYHGTLPLYYQVGVLLAPSNSTNCRWTRLQRSAVCQCSSSNASKDCCNDQLKFVNRLLLTSLCSTNILHHF